MKRLRQVRVRVPRAMLKTPEIQFLRLPGGLDRNLVRGTLLF